jgi:hypothetical protein
LVRHVKIKYVSNSYWCKYKYINTSGVHIENLIEKFDGSCF